MSDEKLKIGKGSGQVDIPKLEADVAVGSILETVYYISGVIAVVVLVIAGFIFVTSAGNPERVKMAKNAIIGAVIGLTVTVMAFAITQFIIKEVEG